MDHPIRNTSNKVLRGRMVQLIKEGFNIAPRSNIVFVCGGNEPDQMRSRFEGRFAELLPKYEFFKPEFAMDSYFSYGVTEPFDIADFETLVADLSIAIVLFPEAPGSFAELGYFSADDRLACKTVLALDLNHQRRGSFISLGPAAKISRRSIFGNPIQIDYQDPDFTLVSARVEEFAKLSKNKRRFVPKKFSDLSPFELFALVHRLVGLLVVATGEDIESLLRSIFASKVNPSQIKKITSILVGSGRLLEVGEYGHLRASDERSFALTYVEGTKTKATEVTVETSSLLYAPDSGFASILEELERC